jgi:hypothetical protein
MIRPWESPGLYGYPYSMLIGRENHLLNADLPLHFQLVMMNLTESEFLDNYVDSIRFDRGRDADCGSV